MSEDPKVVQFPKRAAPRVKNDDALASDVQKCWRRLWRRIADAKRAGLHVDTNGAVEHEPPKITRIFK